MKDCRACLVASTKEYALPVVPMHCQTYSLLLLSPSCLMVMGRGRSLSIAANSCSTCRLARSEVLTCCASFSRHQIHSQYELCSFKAWIFCTFRSICLMSVIFTFSLLLSLRVYNTKRARGYPSSHLPLYTLY